MPPKRSLFNKPAWASKTTSDTSAVTDTSIFASNSYESILEAQKRKQERRIAKLKEREEQEQVQLLQQGASFDTKTNYGKKLKKRKVSKDLEGDAESQDSDPQSRDKRQDIHSRSNSSETSRHEVDRSTPRTPANGQSKLLEDRDLRSKPNVTPCNPEISPVLLIQDDEEDSPLGEDTEDLYITKAVKRKTPQKRKSKSSETVSDSDPDEDDYIKELKRQAREKARRKKLGLDPSQQSPSNAGSQKSPEEVLSPPSALQSPVDNMKGREGNPVREGSATTPAVTGKQEDPEVQILIKTIIPNASGMIVTRKASQPFDRVQEFWCKQNDLEPKIASRVFFTWNGTRLYNSTTMRSILNQIKRKHGTKKDGSDLSEGKIEIEAVTQEIFDHRQQQKQRERERLRNEDYGLLSPTNDDGLATASFSEAAAANTNGVAQSQAEAAPESSKAAGIVIRLVADSVDLEPMNLRVRPNTTMQRIVRGYTKQKQLEDSKTCWLVFDGERMDADMTVEQAAFEDGDTVEVYIK